VLFLLAFFISVLSVQHPGNSCRKRFYQVCRQIKTLALNRIESKGYKALKTPYKTILLCREGVVSDQRAIRLDAMT
jgi:hypothetical protein